MKRRTFIIVIAILVIWLIAAIAFHFLPAISGPESVFSQFQSSWW